MRIPFLGALSTLALTLTSLAACEGPPALETGSWTGTLTPMNHPDMSTPIAYDVRSDDSGLSIDLIGPGGECLPTRDLTLADDTLRFTFNEPEEGIALSCALGRDGERSFAGRCTDADGQWARFTMRHPG